MYLNTVLKIFVSDKRKFTSEDLYKLNEAIFNLPEDDTVDARSTAALFQALERVVKAYNSGRVDDDPNFFYDYVSLLTTMQNQHFFSQKQHKMMLGWITEAVGAAEPPPQQQQQRPPVREVKADPKTQKDIAKLEAENEKMRQQLEKLRSLGDAVVSLRHFKSAAVKDEEKKEKEKAKAKAKSKREKKEKKENSDDSD